MIRKMRVRRGGAVLEVAFVFPLVFFIFLGILEIARGLMVVHLLNNAAQVGCRSGIIEGQSTATIKSAVMSQLTAVGVSGESVTIQVNDGSTDASTAQAGDEITVIVQVPVSAISWVPVAKFLTNSLKGQYTMRRE
jgi:Flp pilus assembly protein TadG